VDLAGGPAASSLTAVVRLPGRLRERPGIQASVSFDGGAWVVSAVGVPIETGDRCVLEGPTTARCPTPGSPDAVLLAGSNGDDTLAVDASVPDSVSATLVGDVGSDLVIGGQGDDNLSGAPRDGPPPHDVLLGRGGEDSLFAAAEMHGGPGSDLLISAPCAGEAVDGGSGIDSVSFARSAGNVGVEATIGGIAGVAPFSLGNLEHDGGCDFGYTTQPVTPTTIAGTVESIEGSPEDDVLRGDGGGNILLGRDGDDRVEGAGGRDFVVGGGGRDELTGEAGADRLYARDGLRDPLIDCGAGPRGGGVARVDPGDPPARCRVLGR
jgi:Ca2+-binding RTX toxin-like protein